MPTTLYLVRHAAHGLLGRTLTGRMPGVDLDADGHVQARRLADRLGEERIAAVVSSPMPRAVQTAAPIAAAHGLPVTIEPGLDEIDFGDWTGSGFEALGPRAEWQSWNRFRSTAPTPGGETMLAAQSRAVAVAARLRREHPGAALVLVSHQDVLKAMLAHWLGVPLDLFHRIELAPASRSIVRLWDQDVRIDGVNLPP